MSENFIIKETDNPRRCQYLVNELLKNKSELVISSMVSGAPNAFRVAETLVRENFASYVDIKTETSVVDNKRKTRTLVKIKKTEQFEKLYNELAERRKQRQEERENQK